ncbi:Guanosine-diphosphatase [Microbotryomycetes sp. JL201]|nr:Guanosine-diphosphatase [Microbotryomycetes sp. JL201]
MVDKYPPQRSTESRDAAPGASASAKSVPDEEQQRVRASRLEYSDDETDGDEPDEFEAEMSLAQSALNGGRRNRGADMGLPTDNKFGMHHGTGTGAGAHPLRALTPRRIAIVAACVLTALFVLGKAPSPSAVTSKLPSSNSLSTDVAGERVDLGKLPDSSPQHQPGSHSSQCTPPPGQKQTTYALMIDAGSTGSRMHVYTFSHCDPTPGALPKLEHEGFFTTKPGLSSYAHKPKDAAESLRSLMEAAVKGVPKAEHACTPIAVKATAGLRLLGEKESTEILQEVERWLNDEWPFKVVKDGVVIMDGKDEGESGRSPLAHIEKQAKLTLVTHSPTRQNTQERLTIEFEQLLGLIGPEDADPTGTAAVMDLGGASTQIVFEPTFDPKSPAKLAPGDHVYDLDFAGKDHVLYQHSHLGYGLMQARRAVHNLIAFQHVWSSAPKGKPIVWNDLTKSDKIHNPCMFKGESKVVKLDPPGREEVQVTMVGTGAGFEACRRVVDVMIAKDAACEEPPCAFAGVYQPALGEVFAAGKVWALSYFYDRIAPLGLESPFSISDLRQLTSDVCAGPSSAAWRRFKSNKMAMEELSDRPEYCLDLTFMYSLLSLGYELEDERQVWIGKKVQDVELGWLLISFSIHS